MKFPTILPHYSPKILLHASLLLLLATPPSTVFAAEEYEVGNVTVDADGKDTSDAEAKAMAKGQKDAFSQLILRLAPAQAAQIFQQVTTKQVENSVRSFSVSDEKMTATHYHAVAKYSFDPSRIKTIVPVPVAAVPIAIPAAAAPASVPAVPAPAVPSATAPAAIPAAAEMPAVSERKAVLVLPVFNLGENNLELWQDDNKWRNVWYDAALESGGGLIVVPLGDLNDRVDVDDTNVSAATSGSLKRMYDRYGIGDVLVLQASYNEKADPKPTLEVSMRKLSAPTAPATQTSYIIHTNETFDGLLARAAKEIARSLFKQQTIDPGKIEYDRMKEISARINTTDIKEWQSLRSRLLMRSNIVDVKFVSISYYETTMTITFKGSPDMLGKTLVASGLRVMQDGDRLVLSLK